MGHGLWAGNPCFEVVTSKWMENFWYNGSENILGYGDKIFVVSTYLCHLQTMAATDKT